MAIITIIRHAEAEGNYYRRAHGHYDSLLAPNGETQLHALRGRFKDIVFDNVYSSDLYRALRTASVLRIADGQPAHALPALREIHLGDWEDIPWGELTAIDPETMSIFSHFPGSFTRRGPSGESMLEMQTRIINAVRGLAQAHTGGHIAVVSHGLAIRALMAALSGLPLDRLHEIPHCDNTAVSRVEWDGHGAARVLFHADNTHLGPLSTLARQHWWRKDSRMADTNLWFQPARLPDDRARILDSQRDAWMAVYGSMDGFFDEISDANTVRMVSAHPRAVVFAMSVHTYVGLLLLDTELVTPDNTGHIALVYLNKESRGQSLGAQLIGHAVSVYRALGRDALHLRVAESNAAARRLYERAGFRETGREEGFHGPLIVMKMGIQT